MKTLISFTFFIGIMSSCTQPKQEPVAPAKEPVPQPIEFADVKYSDLCKQGLVALTSKDIAAFTKEFTDNAVYRFNNGDSIVGKANIDAYWTDRMTNTIETISFSDDIWLSLKVNESEQVKTGNWVLGWLKVTATYKTGKSMTQYIHNLYHFDSNDRLDEVIQYLDRAPIMAAMTPNKK
jgi:hypothetical protein